MFDNLEEQIHFTYAMYATDYFNITNWNKPDNNYFVMCQHFNNPNNDVFRCLYYNNANLGGYLITDYDSTHIRVTTNTRNSGSVFNSYYNNNTKLTGGTTFNPSNSSTYSATQFSNVDTIYMNSRAYNTYVNNSTGSFDVVEVKDFNTFIDFSSYEKECEECTVGGGGMTTEQLTEIVTPLSFISALLLTIFVIWFLKSIIQNFRKENK